MRDLLRAAPLVLALGVAVLGCGGGSDLPPPEPDQYVVQVPGMH
jgi:hypothetical protein